MRENVIEKKLIQAVSRSGEEGRKVRKPFAVRPSKGLCAVSSDARFSGLGVNELNNFFLYFKFECFR